MQRVWILVVGSHGTFKDHLRENVLILESSVGGRGF